MRRQPIWASANPARPKMRSRISAGGGPKGISVAAREKADPPRPSICLWPPSALSPLSAATRNTYTARREAPVLQVAHMCRYGRGDSARGSPIRGQPAYATKPPKGPRRRAKGWCEGISAKTRCTHVVNCCIGESPSFIKSISMPIAIPAGPRNVVGPIGHQSPWWVGAAYSRPRIGVRSPPAI